MPAELKIVKRADGFWITGQPPGFHDAGPYESKWGEIEDDRDGLERHFNDVKVQRLYAKLETH